MDLNINKIIIEPVLSEKSNIQREIKKYVFKVHSDANKMQIMNAVKNLYSVHPVKCNIVNVKAKPKRQRSRMGLTAEWKKAIVTLKKDENIAIFEGAS